MHTFVFSDSFPKAADHPLSCIGSCGGWVSEAEATISGWFVCHKVRDWGEGSGEDICQVSQEIGVGIADAVCERGVPVEKALVVSWVEGGMVVEIRV